ncbi:hypothetical protein ACLB2K_022146 [Fragaria x ananassa]
MQFIFVLPGWEGFASDSRVLHDVVIMPNGLRVPTGYCYLIDGSYTNGEGFLAPYRGTRYHLSEWDGNIPRDHVEYFNMKHSKTRNVIERCFGLLKGRREMFVDPMEHEVFPLEPENRKDVNVIGTVKPSNQWTTWRNDIALQMYNEWRGRKIAREARAAEVEEITARDRRAARAARDARTAREARDTRS